jgi:hypothetical protein
MLVAATADTARVVHRVLVLAALVCCGFVVASFSLFAVDQLSGASKHQQSELAAGVQTTPGSAPSSHRHAQPRRFIDGVARVLTAPFRSVVQSDSQWVLHSVETVCALLLYGLGFGFLARFSSGLSRRRA